MRRDPIAPPDLAGWTAAALAGLAAVVVTSILTGCATEPGEPATSDPNAGLLRDFLDGKFDSAGHPLNARISEGETICASAGYVVDSAPTFGGAASPSEAGLAKGSALRLAHACTAPIAGGEQNGSLVANARIAVRAHAATGTIVTVDVLDLSGTVLASEALTTDRLRAGEWIDWPVGWSSSGAAVQLRVTPAAGATIDLDYVEVFPQRFGLVLAPGSGIIVDSDHLTFELPADRKITKVELDGTDITAKYKALVTAGTATQTTTSFRKLIDVRVADLAPTRGAIAELVVHTDTETQRMQLRRADPACAFVGAGAKVVITGFQPFPADARHGNVSGEAVNALDIAHVRGAQVMRVILPVEYDRAAAEISDVISRCQPDLVISFGQGGDAIALEHTAYNLQDTGEVAGGVPDNRGIVRAAVPIDPAAPAERATLLPVSEISSALAAAGEAPEDSTDPGRYICNNVMFADIAAVTANGHGRAGFIHLPYTTTFDVATKARFAKVVQLAIETTILN